MITPRQLVRLFRINQILIKHGLDEILLHIPIFKPLSFIYFAAPWNWKKKPDDREAIGKRIRLALEDLGPIYIKFGQMLSTRNDLLPPAINDELKKLQDNVPPFPAEQSQKIIEDAFGKAVTEVFQSFDTQPLASASIAQVHTAKMWDGKEVIVKVVRPNIRETIEKDIELLFFIAGMANRYWTEAKRLRPIEVVEEYEMTIIDELDLIREAANASQLRRNFENSTELYIPEVYWDYTHEQVMVMERIYGTPVGNIEELQAKNVNMQRLGELGVEIFFTQVFRHNFFHADMHPGNIFVEISDPVNPYYKAVDFGIVGTLTPDDQRYLAENLHAFFNRDYKRVAELHLESGWVPSNTRVNDFESAIRTVCEPIFNRPIKDISFGFFLLRLFQTARRFDMEVQPQLVLLQKTLLNIEGLGRQLYPDLDLWATAKPFLQRWMDEQVGARSLLNGAKNNLPKFIEQLPHMPTLINDVILQTHQQQRQNLHRASEKESKKPKPHSLKFVIAGSAMLITGGLLSIGNTEHSSGLLQNPLLQSGLIIAGLAFIAASLRKEK
ncbi:MAG: Ubiquinone biosynthesis monooxygenase UbiB [uncultured Thiotrichaceae bacterium]|uniref:Probable protein kinase UbiB n=1 Tax=uncultured Thiotrichaceae bacterium TaxID=298394 RepID=A0A6S6STX9_9GAMM|nr:MAG: Ubiquinone biosynthesis monooxygenase UbiB [uncultured Thiotrichaceae bacterium]